MTVESSGEAPAATSCGFVALIGAPNVGKSTLVNALVGAKVTIVSRKVQTTRALIRGIVIENNAQIILVDTPGIFLPKRRLDRAMVSTAWSGAHDADLVCVLLDAKAGIDEEAEAILTKVASVKHEKILVINKVDLVQREKLLALAQAANERMAFAKTFMIAAISGDGVDDLRHTLAEIVPPGPFLYPEDQMSDAPMRQLAAEITREKIFRKLHQELPYQSTVETDKWEERKDKSVRIEQTIFVERESQRKIVLGAGGATIKSIGADSRKEIGEILGVPVHLFLFVKVRENWGDDPDRYREMGLEFPQRITKKRSVTDERTRQRTALRSAALCILDAGRPVGRGAGPHTECRDDRADDHDGDAARRRHDPAAGLFRLARCTLAQELAAMGAGGSARAVGDLARPDHRREGHGTRQRHRDRLLRADGDGIVFLVQRRCTGLVQRVRIRRFARLIKFVGTLRFADPTIA
ncbi:GTP-binding protein Era [Bradyrhizobium sp. LB7.1]